MALMLIVMLIIPCLLLAEATAVIPYLSADIRDHIYRLGLSHPTTDPRIIGDLRFIDRRANDLLASEPLWKHKISLACFSPPDPQSHKYRYLFDRNHLVTDDSIQLGDKCHLAIRSVYDDATHRPAENVRTRPLITGLSWLVMEQSPSNTLAFLEIFELVAPTLTTLSLMPWRLVPYTNDWSQQQISFETARQHMSSLLLQRLDHGRLDSFDFDYQAVYDVLRSTTQPDQLPEPSVSVWSRLLKPMTGLRRLRVQNIGIGGLQADEGSRLASVLSGLDRLESLSLHWYAISPIDAHLLNEMITPLAEHLVTLELHGPGASLFPRAASGGIRAFKALQRLALIDRFAPLPVYSAAAEERHLAEFITSLPHLPCLARLLLPPIRSPVELTAWRSVAGLMQLINVEFMADFTKEDQLLEIWSIEFHRVAVYPLFMAKYNFINMWNLEGFPSCRMSRGRTLSANLAGDVVRRILATDRLAVANNFGDTSLFRNLHKLTVDSVSANDAFQLCSSMRHIILPQFRSFELTIKEPGGNVQRVDEALVELLWHSRAQRLKITIECDEYDPAKRVPSILFFSDLRQLRYLQLTTSRSVPSDKWPQLHDELENALSSARLERAEFRFANQTFQFKNANRI
jgi:hypothetical protein